MTTSTLTPRQEQILALIVASVNDRGYPPTIRELCDQTGLTSTSSVAHHLRELEHMGAIRRDPGSPRALTITDPYAGVRTEVITERGKEWSK